MDLLALLLLAVLLLAVVVAGVVVQRRTRSGEVSTSSDIGTRESSR